MDILLGLDVGTTNCKVGAYTPAGERVAEAGRPTPTHRPRPQRAEYDVEELWNNLAGAIREVVARVGDPARIRGVAVASMGEAGVPLDEADRVLYPAIAWFDPRTEPQAAWWEEHFGRHELFALTGLPLHPMYSLCKIMWLREQEPDVFCRMKHWLCLEDYVLHRLSGEHATDYSVAGRTMAFDLLHAAWSTRILEAAQIDPTVFPIAYPGGMAIGSVTARAASETGLAKGTPVVTGGHDHCCGSLAVGAYEPGMLLDSTGTSEALLLTTDRPVLTPEVCDANFSYEPHVVPGRYATMGVVMAAGVVIDWVKDLLGEEDYEPLFTAAAESPPGANGLFLLPNFRGCFTPMLDVQARGALVGLTDAHTRGEVFRAALEGICYELKNNVATLERLLGTEVRELRAIGGAARSNLWLQLKADVTGKPVEVPAVTEGTCLGAALLAGLGAGLFADAQEATQRTYRAAQRVDPDPERSAIYERHFQAVYARLYPALREVME